MNYKHLMESPNFGLPCMWSSPEETLLVRSVWSSKRDWLLWDMGASRPGEILHLPEVSLLPSHLNCLVRSWTALWIAMRTSVSEEECPVLTYC